MKGKFNKIFTVTAVLLGICCLAITPAKVKANAFDTVKTNVSQTRKITTKKVKLSSKAKKNKTTTSTRKKTTNANSASNVATSIRKKIETTTIVKTTLTKGSKTKVIKTTVVTKTTTTTTTKYRGVISVEKLAPKAHSSVKNAFNQLGFKIYVDPYLKKYSGVFSVSNHRITVKNTDTSVYHELGHFVSFVAGQYCDTNEFKNIYNSEKNNYVGNNKSYVISSASEYFAESYRDYLLNNKSLKAKRPKTYSAISKALAKITPARVKQVQHAYGMIWKALGK